MAKQLNLIEGDMIKFIHAFESFIVDTQGNKVPLCKEDVLILVGYIDIIENIGIRFTKSKWLFNERIFHFCVSEEADCTMYFKKVET